MELSELDKKILSEKLEVPRKQVVLAYSNLLGFFLTLAEIQQKQIINYYSKKEAGKNEKKC